jgi:hypothetical protein
MMAGDGSWGRYGERRALPSLYLLSHPIAGVMHVSHLMLLAHVVDAFKLIPSSATSTWSSIGTSQE